MNGPPEKGRVPYTAYVDHSFTTSKPTQPHSDEEHPSHATDTTSLLDEALSSADPKRAKFFIRSNHWRGDHDIRRTLWWKVCSTKQKDNISIYNDLANEVFGQGESARDATLPGFVDITCLHHYHLSAAGVNVARRVVCILGAQFPDIPYSPLLFPLTCLLLHYMGEEDCYNCLNALLDSKTKFVTQTKLAYDASKYVLEDLCKKYAKSCYQQLSKRKKQEAVEEVLSQWLWWIFRDLPFPFQICIVDCFLQEGQKVLYRMALAILHLYHKLILKEGETSRADMRLSRDISQFCEDIERYTTIDKLFKIAFGIRGFGIKYLQKLQIKREMHVHRVNTSTSCHVITTSPSVASLDTNVKRSLSGPMGMLAADSVVAPDQWSIIYSWLPSRTTLNKPERIFSTSEHGTSLTTFFNLVDYHEPTLLVIKTMRGEVFGAFCSADWLGRKVNNINLSYFGSGESFVFSLVPVVAKYDWVGKNQATAPPVSAELFQSADMAQIQIGGGNGIAIRIDSELLKGRSEHCLTFDNPPLSDYHDFECATLEVYSFPP